MRKYSIDQWDIYTTEIETFTLDENPYKIYAFEAVSEIDETKEHIVFLYRDDLHSTSLLRYVSADQVHAVHLQTIQNVYDGSVEEHKKVVAVNINRFEHHFGSFSLSKLVMHLEERFSWHQRKKKVSLLGLGDVGSMLAIGLKLLGGDVIEQLGVFDINEASKKRWEMELNQIDVCPTLRVKAIEADELFDADVFVFCASKFVPKVGEEGQDVRMVQYASNAELIDLYAKKAIECDFKGIFAVVSDPVDLLCLKALASSTFNSVTGAYDSKGLLPEQVMGFGLGVMDARAKYYSDLMQLKYRDTGRAFGPHGKDLVVSENICDEDQTASVALTQKVVHSNMDMRALGYKPFIAPALSSGANAIVRLLSGDWHYSAQFFNGIYWGSKYRLQPFGIEMETPEISACLNQRIESSFKTLEATWASLI